MYEKMDKFKWNLGEFSKLFHSKVVFIFPYAGNTFSFKKKQNTKYKVLLDHCPQSQASPKR